MDVDESLKDCKASLLNIEKFNPEPFYVNKFFLEFLSSAINVIESVISEADRDFGLFIKGKAGFDKFREKASDKNDQNALEFIRWYESRLEKENQFPNAKFVWSCMTIFENNAMIPSSDIFLKPRDMTTGDICYPLNTKLRDGRIIDKEELRKSIEYNIPLFVQIINEKRKLNSNPRILKNNVCVCALIDFDGRYFEVIECCKIYLTILDEIIDEAREKIRELTLFE